MLICVLQWADVKSIKISLGLITRNGIAEALGICTFNFIKPLHACSPAWLFRLTFSQQGMIVCIFPHPLQDSILSHFSFLPIWWVSVKWCSIFVWGFSLTLCLSIYLLSYVNVSLLFLAHFSITFDVLFLSICTRSPCTLSIPCQFHM